MKTILFVLASLLLVVGCSTTKPKDLVDENILVPLPIPGFGWTVLSGERGKESVRKWKKPNEYFMVTIYRDRFKPTPNEFQSGMDKAAEKSLVDFKSAILKQGAVNNYPMILWQTHATLSQGTKTFNLLLYIKGNDATYLVQKRWNNTPIEDAERQSWIDYLSSISVCDNRHPEHRCPAMSEQWPGVYFQQSTTNKVEP